MKTGGNSFSSSIVRCVRLNTIVRWREWGSRAKCTYPSVNRDVRLRAVFCRSDLEPDAFNELLSVVGISCTVIGGFSSVFHGSELSRYRVLASCFVRVTLLFFLFRNCIFPTRFQSAVRFNLFGRKSNACLRLNSDSWNLEIAKCYLYLPIATSVPVVGVSLNHLTS